MTVVNCSRGILEGVADNVFLDLTDNASIEQACEHLKLHHSDADILINAAGVLYLEEIEKLSFSATDIVMATNITGMIKFTSHLLPMIERNRGDVVNVGSTVGFKAYPNQSVYGTSKWAVRGFTESLQAEMKDKDVRVIGFYPGGFKSELFKKATGKNMDLSRYMDAHDIAKSLLDILSLPRSMEVSSIIINRNRRASLYSYFI